MFRGNFLCFSLCPLSLSTPEKRFTPFSLHFPFCFFAYFDKILKNLLFTRLNSPSSLSLLECEMLQSLNHLCGPLLDSLHYVHPSFLLGRQKLDTAVQAWPHLCWADRRNHHSWPAGNTSAQAAQELVLTHSKGIFGWSSMFNCQVLSCKAAFQHVLVYVVIPSQVQDLVLSVVNLMRFLSAHFTSLPKSYRMAAQPPGLSAPSSTCVISRLPEGALCTTSDVINGGVEQYLLRYWPPGSTDTSSNQDVVPLIATLWAWPFS